MIKWQDIETAPKDGSAILIYADGYVYVAWWDKHSFGFGTESGELIKPTHWVPINKPESEIKPCMFCHKRPRTEEFSHWYHIECQNCGIVVRAVPGDKDKVIERWNRLMGKENGIRRRI